MTTLNHPTLGQIHGKLTSGVAQYFGIKYASLKHRFGVPELYNGSRSSGVTVADKLGYGCNPLPRPGNPDTVTRPGVIGIPDGCQTEYALIQQRLPVPDFPPQSDTEGLNLTVTVPEGFGNKKLPVFVFIHGGALAMGSSSWPQYDHAAFVRRSAELGLPVIGVNIK